MAPETWLSHEDQQGREITGTDGNDTLRGTNGNDSIFSGLGDDVIYGRGGDDMITSHSGFFTDNDTVFGGKGDDTISVGRGEDVVDGGKGDDDITLNFREPASPFIGDDGVDTVLFNYSSHGNSFGHDTVNVLQQDDVLVFLDKSGQTDDLEDFADKTRLIDAGENAYRIEWLKGDQSVTLHLDNDYLNFGQLPEDQVNWDDFTTLQELATVIDFRFDYDFA